jgi:hypothetical protein
MCSGQGYGTGLLSSTKPLTRWDMSVGSSYGNRASMQAILVCILFVVVTVSAFHSERLSLVLKVVFSNLSTSV